MKQHAPVNLTGQELDLSASGANVGALLIHGLTGTPTEMSPVERRLKKAGIRVSTPMLAGHGLSNTELLETSWEQWLDSVRAALADLSAECDHIFVGGMCMGAMLSMLLAVEEPKIRGIILISVDGGIPAKSASKWAFMLPVGYLLPKSMQKKFYWVEQPPYGLRDPVLQEEITYAMNKSKDRESKEFGTFRTYVRSFAESAQLRKVAFRIAPRIHCASFILQSTEDTLMDPRNAKLVFDKLTGCADREISYIDGCDHVMTVDLKKHEVAARIENFIRRTVARMGANTGSKLDLAEPRQSARYA